MACEIPYCIYGGNKDAILCRDPEVVIAGPAETGKTLAMWWKIHTLANRYPGAQISIIRKVLSDIYGSALRTFKRDFIDRGYAPGIMPYGGEKPQWYDYPNGSRIWVGGLDKPGKTLSSERDMIYVNQCEQLGLPDWEYLTRCVTGRGAVMPYTQLAGDCNPGPPTHWIKGRANEGKLTLFESTHRDNPTLWDRERGEWTEQGERSRATLSNMSGSRLLRLYHGLWAAPEGAIYDVFDEEKHVVKHFDPPALWPRAVGIDPFGAYIAAVWLAWDAQSGVLNVYREYYREFGETTPGHVTNILRETRDETVFAWVGGGPSERQARADWAGAGIPLLEPPIGDVWAGIDRVYQLLKDFRLVVHDNCVNLLSDIGSYRRKLKDGVPTETIENKEEAHMLDALRYIVAWLTEPGERVAVIDTVRPIGPRW